MTAARTEPPAEPAASGARTRPAPANSREVCLGNRFAILPARGTGISSTFRGAAIRFSIIESLGSPEFWVAGILTFLVCWSYLPQRHLWFLPSLFSLTAGNLVFYLAHDEWVWYMAIPFSLLVTLLQFANVLWITYVGRLLVRSAFKNQRTS